MVMTKQAFLKFSNKVRNKSMKKLKPKLTSRRLKLTRRIQIHCQKIRKN